MIDEDDIQDPQQDNPHDPNQQHLPHEAWHESQDRPQHLPHEAWHETSGRAQRRRTTSEDEEKE